MKFKKEVEKITKVLGLKTAPIAGRFSDEKEIKQGRSRKLAICQALRLASRDSLIIPLSKKTCTCSGGRHFSGLEIVPVETFVPAIASKNHKVFDSAETALTSVRKQPQPANRGSLLTLGPLEKFEKKPDFVFFFVNPAQADRILGLVSFRGAEPFMYYPASSICSTITNVLAKNKPEINLIATFERRTGIWSPNELIIALPFKDFETAVENIPKSGFGTYGNDAS